MTCIFPSCKVAANLQILLLVISSVTVIIDIYLNTYFTVTVTLSRIPFTPSTYTVVFPAFTPLIFPVL